MALCLHFPPSLSISSLYFHFSPLSISSFSLHFLSVSSFSPHFLAAWLQGCSRLWQPEFQSKLNFETKQIWGEVVFKPLRNMEEETFLLWIDWFQLHLKSSAPPKGMEKVVKSQQDIFLVQSKSRSVLPTPGALGNSLYLLTSRVRGAIYQGKDIFCPGGASLSVALEKGPNLPCKAVFLQLNAQFIPGNHVHCIEEQP